MTAITKPRIAYLVLISLLATLILYYSRTIIAPFVIAFFLAYALNPLVEYFQKKGAPRDWAIITVYFIVFLIGVCVVQYLAPRVIRDLIRFIQRLPVLAQELQLIESRMIRFMRDWQIPLDWRMVNATFAERSEALIKGAVFQIGHWIVNVFSRSLVYILLPLLAYYISRDYPVMKANTQQWIARHCGARWTDTFLRIDRVFRLYIRCQVLDTLIVGLLIGFGLSILGFEAAFFLGMLAGVFNLIPYFGPVLGAVPALLYALAQSPWKALYVIILFLLVNQLEVMILAPRIMGVTLGLHPLVVIFLILVGGSLFGLPGMIFAVPLGTIILILIQSIYAACFEEPGAGRREPESDPGAE